MKIVMTKKSIRLTSMSLVLTLMMMNMFFFTEKLAAKDEMVTKSLIFQNRTKEIAGVITDNDNIPIPGANIIVEGTTTGTISDSEGKFTLTVPINSHVLVSFIGFETERFLIDEKNDYVFHLTEDSELLEEVIVTGYGTKKKVNLTGAIDVINEETFKDRPATTVSQILQGQVPGLTGFQTGQYGFEPGAVMSFNIRGQGNAYVLVDGIEKDLNQINPSDIESISVLKDAAASAIYGARAAYGVILITTKSGLKGKPKISLNAQTSAVKAIRMPRMVDSYMNVLAINEAAINGGQTQPIKDERIDRIIAFQQDRTLPETIALPNGNWEAGNADYDWFDEYFGGLGLRNQQNVQVSGGSDIANYYFSVGHTYDGGILNYGTDDYRRLNLTTKIDANLTKWWTFSANTYFDRSERENPNYDNQGGYELLMHQIARTPPYQAMKSPNGMYTIQSKIPWARDAGTEKNLGNTFTEKLATKINFTKNWKLNADISFRLENWNWESVDKTVYEDKVDGTLVVSGSTVPSGVSKNQTSKIYLSTNVYTTFDQSIKDEHNFHVMLGTQLEEAKDQMIGGSKKNLISENVPSFSTSTGEITLDDALSHWSTMGYFVRFGYDYLEKYLFEVNARTDGTSKFAEGRRWGIFPSFSLGWNLAKERFMQDAMKNINMFKLRLSWGQLGNQNVSAYQDLPLMGTNSNLSWIILGARPDYTTAPNLINPLLTWETSETSNLGLDLSALNNRLTFSGDIYQRMTRNRLGPAEAIPNVIGASLPRANNSTMRTKGWEVSLGWSNHTSYRLSYFVKVMLSDYQNEITRYNNPTKILTTDYEGKKVGEIWGYVTDGFILTQEDADEITNNGTQKQFYGGAWNVGDIRYKDLDGVAGITTGDNTVNNPGDRRVIGNSTPRYQFGLNTGLEYKNFNLAVFFQGIGKRDLALEGNMFWGFANSGQESLYKEHMDYFRDREVEIRNDIQYVGLGINTDAYFPKPYRTNALNSKNQQIQSGYIQDGSYLRLKNLQFGYTFPKKWTDNIHFSNIRIYFSGDNILTFTSKNFHSPLDPETANVGRKGDGKSYFSQAVYSIGIDLQF